MSVWVSEAASAATATALAVKSALKQRETNKILLLRAIDRWNPPGETRRVSRKVHWDECRLTASLEIVCFGERLTMDINTSVDVIWEMNGSDNPGFWDDFVRDLLDKEIAFQVAHVREHGIPRLYGIKRIPGEDEQPFAA